MEFQPGDRVKVLKPRYLHRVYHDKTGAVDSVAPDGFTVTLTLDSGVKVTATSEDVMRIATVDFETKG